MDLRLRMRLALYFIKHNIQGSADVGPVPQPASQPDILPPTSGPPTAPLQPTHRRVPSVLKTRNAVRYHQYISQANLLPTALDNAHIRHHTLSKLTVRHMGKNRVRQRRGRGGLYLMHSKISPLIGLDFAFATVAVHRPVCAAVTHTHARTHAQHSSLGVEKPDLTYKT
jgi:hypothetical protein